MRLLPLIFFITLYGCAQDSYYYNNNQQSILIPLENPPFRTLENLDYYQTENEVVVGVGDKIIVKTLDNTNLNLYLSEFNSTLLEKLDTNLYVIQTPNKNLTIDIANRLTEKEDIDYAHPDFVKKRIAR